jgi:hypothetical protein
MFPLRTFSLGENYFLLGWIMSSPEGDGNVRAIFAVFRTDSRGTVSNESLCRRRQRSGFEDDEDLAFGNHVVEADQYRFELARGRRSDRNFHFHGFDECNVVAIADAVTDFNGKRADAPGHLGHNLDVWHSAPRHSRPAHRDRNTCIMKAGALGLRLWPQIA